MSTFLLTSDIAEITEHLGDTAQALAGKTILLTGARGFLGRYLTETFAHLNRKRLRRHPCKVIATDNLITAGALGKGIRDYDGVTFVKHDVIQPLRVKKPVHFILHAAGIASPYYYRAYPLETLDVAITGTRHMLDIAREQKARLLFFSSSEIYGDPDQKSVPTPESYRGSVDCLGARACYDESKRVGETLCRIYHTKFGVDTNMVRPFNVYGPGMQETDYRVLPNFASRIKGKKPLHIYGSGNQTRTFCYINDAIVGFLKVLAHGVPGEPYNIGNPKPEISMLQLAKQIEKVLGHRIEIATISYPDSYPADEPNRRCPDITKASLQLDFRPRVPLREGLKRFLGWTNSVYTGEQ
jgi:UDP-glucuronate decarboxylase